VNSLARRGGAEVVLLGSVGVCESASEHENSQQPALKSKMNLRNKRFPMLVTN